MIKFDDITAAFYFVNSSPYGGNQAYLCRKTGEIFYESDFGDSEELPEDLDDAENYLCIPHKNDLELGWRLVEEFMLEAMPEKLADVAGIFRKKGAYARFKNLLEGLGLLEGWYQFEKKHTDAALRQWCADEGLECDG